MSKKKANLQDDLHALFEKYEIQDFICTYQVTDDRPLNIEFNCELSHIVKSARAMLDFYNTQTNPPETPKPSRIILQ